MDYSQSRGVHQLPGHVLGRAAFENRNFSRKTIVTLVAAGICAPEWLLLMTDKQASNIPWLGDAARREVRAYRSKFIRSQKVREINQSNSI
jgi:hypothetical protein